MLKRRVERTRAGAVTAALVPAVAQSDGARTLIFSLQSSVLPEPASRNITVYLPDCYAREPQRRFPVFYLHDGQNLMDPATSYLPGRTWRAGETTDRMVAEGKVEPVILVGVANTGLRRMAEYTPTKDFKMGGGDGDRYGHLLINELKPAVDRLFRTLTRPEETGLGGSSLGGLISLYLGLGHPDVFGRLAVISPSLWWNHRAILSFVKARKAPVRPRIWLDIGTGEGLRHVRDTELLERLLWERGWTEGVDLRTLVVPGGMHDEDAWAARFDKVLEFLFPARG
jgi:predicted alpha/beta superfamily hydrolase